MPEKKERGKRQFLEKKLVAYGAAAGAALAVCCLLIPGVQQSSAQEHPMLTPSDFGGGVVAWRPDQFYGWPGLTRVQGEEILAAASERKHHACPYGRIVVMRSLDGGRSWGLPQEIYNSELDDRDATLITMPDGTICCTWFTSCGWMEPPFLRPEWAARRDRVTDKMIQELVGDWLIRSTDGGRTWEKVPHRMPPAGAGHVGLFVLSDGSLACFGYDIAGDSAEMFFYKSQDKGDTWQKMGRVPCPDRNEGIWPWLFPERLGKRVSMPEINERGLVELAPNRYLVVFRHSSMQSSSEDGGETWSPAERRMPAVGMSYHLLKLSSGPILATCMLRREPWSIRAMLSYDEGKTWDSKHVITVDQWEDHPDMGYPVSLEVSPGEILTIYYCSRQPLTHKPDQEATFKPGSTPEGILFKTYRLQ